MIYTSYFGNYKNLPKDAAVVGISLYPPKWWKGKNLYWLAPGVDDFDNYKSGVISQELFGRFYKKSIERIGADNIRGCLEDLFPGQDIILLCWEVPGDFCHRRILGEYIGAEEFVIRN